MRAAALLGLLALAACAGGRAEMPVPAGVAESDPRVVPCRREAAAAPQVREIARRQPTINYGDAYDRWRDDMKWAERNGFIACLVREGALTQVPSGVAPVQSGNFGYDDRTPPSPLNALPQATRPAPSGY
jgi:hypothetical protein